MVRRIHDELEAAAPWDQLYYPSQDDATFLAMELALLEVIDRIPRQVEALIESLREEVEGEAGRRLLGDAEFFFEGIHGSVAPDIAKLRSKLKSLQAAREGAELTPEQRDFTCEITADLKGKYASSIMGAAAGLIAEDRWDGVEIEPILFPEKAEEFERNEHLVETLNEVIENITNLLAEVPLAEMVERWREERRVDLYALTPLYSFLGNLGRLMKEESRRALYSGDYHQIRKRERLLNVRINELTTLHNMTWATDSRPAMPDGSSPYPQMIRKSTELAAILDVEILRQIIGEKSVKDLLFIVTIEKERVEAAGGDPGAAEASSMRKSVPEELHPLIPLLYGEDLLNFLSLLLGAVLKRASLALKRQRASAAAPAPDEPPPEAPAEPKAPGELDTGEFDKAELEALAKERASEERDTAEFEVPAELVAPAPPGEAEPETPAVETPETEVPAPPEAALPEPALPEIDDLPGIDAPLPPKPEPIIDTSLLAEALEELDFELPGVGLPDLPGTDLPGAGLPEPEPEPTPVDSKRLDPGGPALRRPDPLELEKRAALAELYDLLETLLSRANAHRKSFELVHRLLKQRKTVPPAMLQSMHPYLFDIMNSLIPQLHDLDHLTDISANHAANLFEYCTFLCDRNLTPEQIRGDVPRTMDRVLRLLDGLHGTASKLVADAPH